MIATGHSHVVSNVEMTHTPAREWDVFARRPLSRRRHYSRLTASDIAEQCIDCFSKILQRVPVAKVADKSLLS
jgi:hypothetical protein